MSPTQPEDNTFCLRAEKCLADPDDRVVYSPGYLSVENGEITGVGPASDMPESARKLPEVQLDNHLVMPGLVNTHSHLSMTGLRGYAEDLPLSRWLDKTYQYRSNELTAQDHVDAYRLGLAECLLHGITTTADMSFYQHRYAESVRESGIRAILYDTTMEEYLGSDRQQEILDFIRRDFPDRIQEGAALHAPYTTNQELLDWFLEHVVEPTEVPYSIHLEETREEALDFRADHGLAPTEWLAEEGFLTDRCQAVHGVWLSPEDLTHLEDHGVGLSHNPNSNMKLGAGTADLPAWLERTLAVGLGTDSAASNNRLDLFQEMDTAAKLQKLHTRNPSTLPAETVVRLATSDGARSLNLGNRVGRLLPGYEADLIALDLDSVELTPVHDPFTTLVYTALGRDVDHVWVEGKPVVQDGQLLTLDREEIISTVRERYDGGGAKP